MAIINQIKQQFRALFEKKPELLVPVFQLALIDALSFNKETKEGGMDASILYRIDQPEYAKLKPAAAEIERIRGELVDKTQVTRADLIAFGGAVAIEATGGPADQAHSSNCRRSAAPLIPRPPALSMTAGGPRVIVQLGRSDGRPPADGAAVPAPLWDVERPTAEGIRAAAERSGLTEREAVALAGALGSLQAAAVAMAARVSDKRPPCSDDDSAEVRQVH